MAKARANGTPAKNASPAKGAKSQATTPDGATRRSPRHATLSLKVQEAAANADRVQDGRVTKKTSPAKAKATPKKTSPVKKSPAKAKSPAKKETPAKKASPAKARSPDKKSPAKKSPAKSESPAKKASPAKTKSPAKKSPARAKSSAKKETPTRATRSTTAAKKETPSSNKAKAEADDGRTPGLRAIRAKIELQKQEEEQRLLLSGRRDWPVARVEAAKKDPFGAEALEYEKHILKNLSEYPKRLVSDSRTVSMEDLKVSYTLLFSCYVRFFRPGKAEVAKAFRAALGPTYRKLRESVEHVIHSSVDGFLDNKVMDYIFVYAVTKAAGDPGAEELERDSIPTFGYDDFASMSAEMKRCRNDRMAAQIRKLEGREQPGDRKIIQGRVSKPASRAASRSRSPAKGRSRRTSDTSASRSARTRSKSPVKASPRQSSVAPASRGTSRTRSKSPAKSTTKRTRSPSEPSPSTTKRTRATSPAKAASDPPVASRARSKSPAKAASEKPIATRARSKSPAKKPASQSRTAAPDWEDEWDPVGSGSSRLRSKSPAKAAVNSSRARSKSPAKRSTSQNRSTASSRKGSSDPAALPSDGTKAPPNSIVSSSSRGKSPAKTASELIVSARARSKSPAKRSASQSYSTSAKAYPAQAGRGTIISASNPQTIAELNNKRNPFHETLPAPEVWHRNMPPYFPFGETKYMEQEISRQIDEDLQRGMQETREAVQKNDGIFKTGARMVSNAASAVFSSLSPPKPRVQYPPQWALPQVAGVQGYTDEEILASASRRPSSSGSKSRASPSKKKTSSIQRRRDEDEDDDDDGGDEDMPFF